jgi:murein DD-endopeptidase MepM/ murein hydrolase activator NlpD
MLRFHMREMIAGLGAIACIAASAGNAAVRASPSSAAKPDVPGAQETLPSGDSEAFRARMNWEGQAAPQSSLIEITRQASPKHFRVSSQFGLRQDPLRGGRRQHAGMDFPGRMGANVYATGAGRVDRAGWAAGYGNLIEIAHAGGLRTRYGHLSSIAVAAGDSVVPGQLIGKVGSTGRSTGPHLHYEVRVDGVATDPTPFLTQGQTEYRVNWAPQQNAEPRWTGWDGDAAVGLPQSVIK